MFLGGWEGESFMLGYAHLYVLKVHPSSFGADQQGEMTTLFSVWHNIKRLSMG
jgi:hypothetical protein